MRRMSQVCIVVPLPLRPQLSIAISHYLPKSTKASLDGRLHGCVFTIHLRISRAHSISGSGPASGLPPYPHPPFPFFPVPCSPNPFLILIQIVINKIKIKNSTRPRSLLLRFNCDVFCSLCCTAIYVPTLA